MKSENRAVYLQNAFEEASVDASCGADTAVREEERAKESEDEVGTDDAAVDDQVELGRVAIDVPAHSERQ